MGVACTHNSRALTPTAAQASLMQSVGAASPPASLAAAPWVLRPPLQPKAVAAAADPEDKDEDKDKKEVDWAICLSLIRRGLLLLRTRISVSVAPVHSIALTAMITVLFSFLRRQPIGPLVVGETD